MPIYTEFFPQGVYMCVVCLEFVYICLCMYIGIYASVCVCLQVCVYRCGVWGSLSDEPRVHNKASLASQLALELPWPGFLGAGSTGGPPATTSIWPCLGSQPSTDFYINLCKHGHQNIFFLYMALNDHFTSFSVSFVFPLPASNVDLPSSCPGLKAHTPLQLWMNERS